MDKIMSLGQSRTIEPISPNRTTKLQNKFEYQSSILERLREFAASVPDFRRPNKGNIRHKLADIIMLMILARTSGHVGRADIIEFGKHNINKFRECFNLAFRRLAIKFHIFGGSGVVPWQG